VVSKILSHFDEMESKMLFMVYKEASRRSNFSLAENFCKELATLAFRHFPGASSK
jgi:hypothetical protein